MSDAYSKSVAMRNIDLSASQDAVQSCPSDPPVPVP